MREFRRGVAVLCISAGALLTGGCVAPMLAGAAAGAGVFGVQKGTNALVDREAKRRMENADQLKHLSAASLGVASDDILAVSDTNWRGSILHWQALTRDGRRFKCESGAAVMCEPLAS